MLTEPHHQRGLSAGGVSALVSGEADTRGAEVLFAVAVSTWDGAMWDRWWLVIRAGLSNSGEGDGGQGGTGDPRGLTLGLSVLLLLVFLFINFNWISIWSACTVQVKLSASLLQVVKKINKKATFTFSALIL